jgi:Xaa-Pro dipeptidase
MACKGVVAVSVSAQASVEPYLPHDFGAEEFEQRLREVRTRMRADGLDSLLVVGPENIYYLTGLNYQGYFALTVLVVPVEGPLLLVARAMEAATIAVQAPTCTHVAYGDETEPAQALVVAVAQTTAPGDTVGVELAAMFFPPGVWDPLRANLPDRAWVDASGLVVGLRMVKSPAELACIQRAARISDRAVQAGIAAASSETTEREVAAAVYAQLVRAGSEHPGFAPLIRGTDILTHEHVTWRDRQLRAGSSLLLELSASVYRYHAPLTRMLPIDDVDAGTARAAEIACAALEAVRAAMVPGAVNGDVYDVWQGVVDDGLGHHDYRRHHCGYMVGIGFPPSWVGGSVQGIRRGGDFVLRAGMVFHVLSWLLGQRPGDYCVSDTVVVAPEGGRFLTRTIRNLAMS